MRAKYLLVVMSLLAATACADPFRDVDLRATVTGPSTLKVGASASLIVTVTSRGYQQPTGPGQMITLAWSSSDPAVATISAVGRVTGVAPGLVTISALPVDDLVGGARVAGTLQMTIVP